VNAITPKDVAASVIVASARCRAFFVTVTQVSVTYRSATRDDAASIIEFQLAMARETEDVSLDTAVTTQGVHAVIDDPSRGRYFVAESDGRVVASLLITYEWSDWRNGVVWWIQSVYVRPELRKQGIYAALYRHVQSIAERENVRGIRLYVDRRNTVAQRVYSRLGMNGEHYLVFEWMRSDGNVEC
jgi:GNAT superfamily N-acetyltransferase